MEIVEMTILLNRTPIYLALIVFLGAMYGLFFIKEKVMMLHIELKEVKRLINLEKDSMHILKAELAYLSSPDRLAELNEHFLQLKTTSIDQVVSDPLHMNPDSRKQHVLIQAINKGPVKWRFKKRPQKYMVLVGGRQ